MSLISRAAVILSTYNSPHLLERVLAGYAVQTHRDFEIVVADDGSGEATRALLERSRAELGLRIGHVWQEDRGFRKCAALNRAIAAAEADYLIFSDGDCIPHPEFVATHLGLAASRRFLSGGYLKLPEDVSAKLTREHVLAGSATDLGFLRSLGLPWSLRMALRLGSRGAAATLLDALTPTRATWNGHNASCWRADALRANGFDERMGYGGEDREFGERLMNAGVQPKQIRHRAPCVHLWHSRGYVDPARIAENRAIRAQTRRRRATVTDFGIRPPSAAP
jgi:glycosyltransferase involved in cell wall biosynthesis